MFPSCQTIFIWEGSKTFQKKAPTKLQRKALKQCAPNSIGGGGSEEY